MDHDLITAVKEVIKVYSVADWNDRKASAIHIHWLRLDAVIKRELNEELSIWDKHFFYSYEGDTDEKEENEFVYKIISAK